MLSLLHIENIAVIEQADISFDKGFNVLTGETGAGKSIVIDAISAIMGERAYRDMIRTGTTKASVRGVFTQVPELSWFQENGVEYDQETVIQRDVYRERTRNWSSAESCCKTPKSSPRAWTRPPRPSWAAMTAMALRHFWRRQLMLCPASPATLTIIPPSRSG